MNQVSKGLRDDPVIVLGMHHSGTSIFSELLHRHGVFMDPTRKLAKRRYESKFFIRLNALVMGGEEEWTRCPILGEDEVLSYTDKVQSILQEQNLKKYLRDGYDGQSPWGWKDPRTCVTLPLYRETFPSARFVHIVRNRDDVIDSLVRRSRAGGRHVDDRTFWGTLTDQYVARVRSCAGASSYYYEFTYEDFCLDSLATCEGIFAFLRLPFTAEAKEFLRTHVYSDRIRAGR